MGISGWEIVVFRRVEQRELRQKSKWEVNWVKFVFASLMSMRVLCFESYEID